jgi:hypothetical protein
LRWAGQVPRWPHLFFAQLFGRHWLWEPVRGDARFREFLGALKE